MTVIYYENFFQNLLKTVNISALIVQAVTCLLGRWVVGRSGGSLLSSTGHPRQTMPLYGSRMPLEAIIIAFEYLNTSESYSHDLTPFQAFLNLRF